MSDGMPVLRRWRWWWGDLLCRLGRHKAEPYREYRDRWGDTASGGDCVRCGQGPL